MTTPHSTQSTAAGKGAHPTWLVGEHIYLRTIETTDADYAVSWRQGMIRRGVAATTKWIEEELPDDEDIHLVIVRKSDDRPVGSVILHTWRHTVWINGYIDPLFGETGHTWLGEALVLAAQWQVDERQKLVAYIWHIPATCSNTITMLEAAGARIAATNREMYQHRGSWYDTHMISYLNRDWITALGDPFEIEPPATETNGPKPVITTASSPGDTLPPSAVRIGPRVYLRPMRKDDTQIVTDWARRETDTVWDSGRSVFTRTSLEQWYASLEKSEPYRWVRFTVCLRANDEVIGEVGIAGINYQHRYGESESALYNPDYRAQGYGSEAKHLLLDYAFNTLGLHSIQSEVFYPNTRSAAALLKQGYRRVGFMPWLIPSDGTYINFGLFDLLADDWRALPRMESEGAE